MTESSPLVTIIIPAYNAEAYLSRAIDSLLAQTYQNLEIIVVEDASPDATGRIADEYAARDARVRVIHNAENRRRSGSINTGIEAARGEFIGFLDADDEYKPYKVAEQVAHFLEHPAVDMVYGDFEAIRTDGTRVVLTSLRSGTDAYDRLRLQEPNKPILATGIIPSCSPLIRAHVFKKARFDETLRNMEDLDLWLRIIGAGFAIERIPHITYTYWHHENQKSRNKENMEKAAAIIRERIAAGAYLNAGI